MGVEDAHQTRMVQRELSKRLLDISLLDVRVSHGVVYLRGTVRKMRGSDIDLKREMDIIRTVLRQRPGIREVIDETTKR